MLLSKQNIKGRGLARLPPIPPPMPPPMPPSMPPPPPSYTNNTIQDDFSDYDNFGYDSDYDNFGYDYLWKPIEPKNLWEIEHKQIPPQSKNNIDSTNNESIMNINIDDIEKEIPWFDISKIINSNEKDYINIFFKDIEEKEKLFEIISEHISNFNDIHDFLTYFIFTNQNIDSKYLSLKDDAKYYSVTLSSDLDKLKTDLEEEIEKI